MASGGFKKKEKEGTKLSEDFVRDFVNDWSSFVEGKNDYLKTAIKIIQMHPKCKEFDFSLEEIDNEELAEPRDRVFNSWKSSDVLATTDLRSHLSEMGMDVDQLESDETELLVNATPEQKKRFKDVFLAALRKKRMKRSSSESRASRTTKLTTLVKKEISIYREKRAKRKKNRPHSPISNRPKVNTPVKQSPLQPEVDEMLFDVQLLQLLIRIYASKVADFELMYLTAPELHGRIKDEDLEYLHERMVYTLVLKLDVSSTFNSIDDKLRERALFKECAELYEEMHPPEGRIMGSLKLMASKYYRLQEPPKKTFTEEDLSKGTGVKSKRSASSEEKTKEDKLVDVESPERILVTPVKRQKSTDEGEGGSKEVTRRLRKTSMSDEDPLL